MRTTGWRSEQHDRQLVLRKGWAMCRGSRAGECRAREARECRGSAKRRGWLKEAAGRAWQGSPTGQASCRGCVFGPLTLGSLNQQRLTRGRAPARLPLLLAGLSRLLKGSAPHANGCAPLVCRHSRAQAAVRQRRSRQRRSSQAKTQVVGAGCPLPSPFSRLLVAALQAL